MSYNLGTASGKIVVDGKGAAQGFDIARDSAEAFFDVVKARMGGLDELANKLIKIGVAGGAGLAGAITSAASFEQRIDAIRAVSGATEAQMQKVSEKALQLGADTVFSAGESASAIEELVKAGISLEDVLTGAADATVNLAAAGDITLAAAAEIAANAINNFNLKGRDTAHVADMIAGAANASSISVGDFGSSLQQAGAVAALSGLNIDDLSVAIAEMGKAGIKGSDAGTSIKTFLLNLQPTTERQKKLFDDLGLSVGETGNAFFDASGNVRSMAEIQQVLADAVQGMTRQQKLQTLEILFGQDAIRAAAVLADEAGAGYNAMAESMSKVKAADVAMIRLDNLRGSLEQLRGSVESAAIAIGTPLLGAVRMVVDAATWAVNVFNNLPKPVQDVIAVMLGVGAATALFGGVLIKVLPLLLTLLTRFLMVRQIKAIFDIFRSGWVAIQAGQGILAALSASFVSAKEAAAGATGTIGGAVRALRSLRNAGLLAKIALGGVAAAVAVGIAAFLMYQEQQAEAAARTEELTQAILLDNGAIGQNTREYVVNALAKNGMFEAAQKLGIGLKDVTDAALGDEAAMARVNKIMDDAIQTNEKYGNSVAVQQTEAQKDMQRSALAADKLRGGLGGLNGEVTSAVDAANQHSEAMDGEVEGLQKVGDEASDAATKLRDLVNAIFAASEAAAGATRADLNLADSKDALIDALKRSDGKIGKKGGKDARDALGAVLDYRDSLKGVVEEQLKLDPSGKTAAAALKKAQDSFTKVAKAAGVPAPKIAEMIKLIGAIPENVSTTFNMAGANVSKKEAKELAAAVKTIPQLATVKIVAKNARPSKKEVKDFSDTIKGLPKEQKVAVVAAYKYGGLEGAKTALNSLPENTNIEVSISTKGTKGVTDAKKAIDEMQNKNVTVTVKYRTTGPKDPRLPQARAKGGPIKKGRMYLVGEKGPELIRAQSDGEVFDASTTRSMLRTLNDLGTRSLNAGTSSDLVSALRGASSVMTASAAKISRAASSPSTSSSSSTYVDNRKFDFKTINPIAEKSSESNLKASARVGTLGAFS